MFKLIQIGTILIYLFSYIHKLKLYRPCLNRAFNVSKYSISNKLCDDMYMKRFHWLYTNGEEMLNLDNILYEKFFLSIEFNVQGRNIFFLYRINVFHKYY